PAPEAAEPEPGVSSSSYALLDCPEGVVAEVEFPLTVGISPLPMVPGDEPLDLPPTPGYVLVVHVIAEGFRLRAGEPERHELAVTHENPYPTVVLHLTPDPQDTRVRLRRIRANYSVGGQAIGFADRPLVVVESAELLDSQIPRPVPRPGTIHVPTAGTAPDLTLTIRLGDSVGDLLWTLESPHAIELPDRRLQSDIGKEPDRFARQIVDLVNGREGTTGLYTFLVGIGREVTQEVPVKVWKALRAAAAKRGGPPDLLILSQEPYIPWELAVMPEPLLDPQAPPFLAAQANVGRWIIRKDLDEEDGGSLDRPRLPPPTELAIKGLAVVSGVYSSGKWQRLKEAEQEAAELAQLYPAASVNADFETVTGCLKGIPEADMLHFAVHGVYNPESVEHGLMLVDKRVLHPFDVKGIDLTRAPFVFLNACQVGSGEQVLGDYAGLAEAFLFAGASGVIAPLWSVKDTVARQVALDFYREIAAGRTPADIVRAARARFKDAAGPLSATYLAYQFFGHPQLKLTGLRPREEGQP
ncbi:MAG TPA: CHAT domain-containing protein, partial [Thermoanaerobaculia bacterium]|nr:CHAT domain-containing protein [Thermoanaerobaculia bacterium]